MTGILVHEWLAKSGGSEKVFDRFVADFPDADVLCLWNDVPGRYGDRAVEETWLARTPLRRSKSLSLPLMPMTWRRRKGPEYDWALVSSHLFAHHVSFAHPAADFQKYVYVHTPARYIWTPEFDERGASIPVRLASAVLRPLDRRRAQEPSTIIANSRFVRNRIAECWDRDAEVVYPPVDVERIQSVGDWASRLTAAESSLVDSLPDTYLLGASRFVEYKRLDVVIRAGEAAGIPVVIAGSGPEEAALRAQAASASVPVHVVIRPSDELLFTLFQRALVFVFPPVEDFGIMPVEAMAAGTPVVVSAQGGAGESVQAPLGGELLQSHDPAVLREAVVSAAAKDRGTVAALASAFSNAAFDAAIISTVTAAERR
jgi:glycosyltransferase involved in cell wall biosynthesis